jgi:hypothetical protein
MEKYFIRSLPAKNYFISSGFPYQRALHLKQVPGPKSEIHIHLIRRNVQKLPPETLFKPDPL